MPDAGKAAAGGASAAGHRPRHRGGKHKPASVTSNRSDDSHSTSAASLSGSLPWQRGSEASTVPGAPRSSAESDYLFRSSFGIAGGAARPEEFQRREEFVIPTRPRVRLPAPPPPRPADGASSSEGSTRVPSCPTARLGYPDLVRGVLAAPRTGSSRGSSAAGSSSRVLGHHEPAGKGCGAAAAAAVDVPWDSLAFGAQIQPYLRHAHRLLDVSLLSRFLEISRVEEISGESVKLLLRTLKFLRACDYHNEDICCVLAHASYYFIDAFTLCGNSMSSSEVGNVLAVLTFVAHAWVQDETCPLRIWHQHLFKQYCQLDVLHAAVVRLLEIRNYTLRLEREEVEWRFTHLKEASSAFPNRPPPPDFHRLSNTSFAEPLRTLADQLVRCLDRSAQ